MAYRARKLYGSGRGHHSPGSHSPRSHSPRVSGCKLTRRSRPVRSPADRPLLLSRDPDTLPPLVECDLITQIYAAQQDLPLREFASYFNGRSNNNIPPCFTSHEVMNGLSPVIPLYNTSVRWNPNQQIGVQKNTQEHEYNCRCLDCTSALCPGEAGLRNLGNFKFKNNIMKFCDKHTMTPKVNDISCGICLGVASITDKAIEVSSNDVRTKPDVRRETFCRQTEPSCSWVPPILKNTRDVKIKRDRCKTVVNNDDVECWAQQWLHGQDEAVRDTDPPELCYELLEQSPAAGCPVPPNTAEKQPKINSNDANSEGFPTRIMLYNEGISDDIANNLAAQCIRKCSSPNQLQSGNWRCPETETWIPYSHKGNSRYHAECRKPVDQRYRCETELGDVYRTLDCPRRYPARRSTVVELEESTKRSCNNKNNEACPIRKTVYNEGISDDITKNFTKKQTRKLWRSPHSKSSCVSLEPCCLETETRIPHSHKGYSKYHVKCKSDEQQYQCDAELDNLYRMLLDCSQRFVGNTFCKKPMKPELLPDLATNLPKKTLASEKDIDLLIFCNRDFVRQ